MRNYYDEDEDDEEEDEGRERMFDLQDLFQGMDGDFPIEYPLDGNANRDIFESALRFLESSFWWKFRSHTARMRLLLNTYNQFQEMLLYPGGWMGDEEGEEEEEEEEEQEEEEDGEKERV